MSVPSVVPHAVPQVVPHVVPYGQPGFMQAYGAVWSCGDAAHLGNYFNPQGVYIESSYGDSYAGREQVGRFSRFMHAFSKEVKIEYLSHCGTAELFALEWLWSGVATGPIRLHGKVHAPTNRSYSVPGVAICKADAQGLILLHRDYYDLATLMRQIGIDGAAAGGSA